ncbi:nitrate- and nitrite sensing domain-containing protein [Lentzea sp. NPDC092896]|uniref:nitrate- and nitrite sensing domain-containing protein n=1 Tax=Lentzea sp. NPDC092896 TaxID=3364127 RepID=UPI0037F200B4
MVSSWRLSTMSHWSVRTKLVVVMVPLALAVFGLAGKQIVAQENTYGELVSAQHALDVCTRGWEVTDALQTERSAVMSYIHSGRRDTTSLVEAAQRVDTAHEALRAAVRKPEKLTVVMAATADKALTELDGLDGLRRTVQQTRYPDVSALARYGQILDGLVRLGRSTADSVSTLPVGSDVAALQSLGAAQEHLTVQNVILLAAAHTRDLPPQQAILLRAAQSRFDAAIGEFNTAAGPALRQRYQDTVSGAEVDERSRLVQLALVQSGANRPITVDAAAAARTGEATANRITAVRDEVTTGAVTTTDALATAARTATVAVSGGLVVVLLIAFAVAALVARTILRPLRVLRGTALRVARRDLPVAIDRILAHKDPLAVVDTAIEAVPIDSSEEIGQVARAFDTVLTAAVRLAAQHAVLRDGVNAGLVNLARRSQTLIERLMKLIDVLESDEQDPDRLAQLFELDHVGTRMRRNSENLLVLSGAGLGIPLLTRPVALHEVFGAAVSEVERYTRVDTEVQAEVAVLGHVVKDLVHLLAELLDNATVMSEPTTRVSLRGALGRARDLVIEVSDDGVGMDDNQIRQYNRQLAAPPDLDVRAAERMGLHVIGRLAERHRIIVTLRANDDLCGGITARVAVPADLLDLAQPPAAPAPQASTAPQPELLADTHHVDLFQPRAQSEHAPDTAEAHTAVLPMSSPPARHTLARHVADAPAPQDDDRVADHDSTQVLEPITQLPEWFTPAQDAVLEAADGNGARAREAESDGAQPRSGQTALAELSASRKRIREATVWDSPGDPGWEMANAILAAATPAPRSSGHLPKRTPRARLVPGSPLAPTPVSASATDPARIRERLARFQQGVQRGREEDGTPRTHIATTKVTDR